MDTDDLPATDDVEQPERLALPALDSFRAVRDLIALCIDPRTSSAICGACMTR
jgi:hypothetical protein